MPTTTLPALLAELEAMEAKATPGPWEWYPSGVGALRGRALFMVGV